MVLWHERNSSPAPSCKKKRPVILKLTIRVCLQTGSKLHCFQVNYIFSSLECLFLLREHPTHNGCAAQKQRIPFQTHQHDKFHVQVFLASVSQHVSFYNNAKQKLSLHFHHCFSYSYINTEEHYTHKTHNLKQLLGKEAVCFW